MCQFFRHGTGAMGHVFVTPARRSNNQPHDLFHLGVGIQVLGKQAHGCEAAPGLSTIHLLVVSFSISGIKGHRLLGICWWGALKVDDTIVIDQKFVVCFSSHTQKKNFKEHFQKEFSRKFEKRIFEKVQKNVMCEMT